MDLRRRVAPLGEQAGRKAADETYGVGDQVDGANGAALSLSEKSQKEDTSVGADMNKRTSWIVFAVASGGCAAFNGVFAKLTTTELTTSIAGSVARALGLGEGGWIVEYLIRGIFFSLNLAFNALMWALFTRALTLNSSTTRVSILNTSTNFLFTALLGLLIFRESLPPLWFAGAAMLVIGNVIIGRREEDDTDSTKDGTTEEGIGLMDGVPRTAVDEEQGRGRGRDNPLSKRQQKDEQEEDESSDDDPLLSLRACTG